MSVERVHKYLAQFGRENDILEMPTSTATVALAAQALGTEPARIAKTIAMRGAEDGKYIVIVAAGDTKLDNKKFKSTFGCKARMLCAEETLDITGYAVGGVCPFGLDALTIDIFLDKSLKRFETVYPACGTSNSAIEVTMPQLEQYTNNPQWVDVCKDWQEE